MSDISIKHWYIGAPILSPLKQFVQLALCKPYTFTLLAILIVVLGALGVFIVTVLSVANAAHPLPLP